MNDGFIKKRKARYIFREIKKNSKKNGKQKLFFNIFVNQACTFLNEGQLHLKLQLQSIHKLIIFSSHKFFFKSLDILGCG